MADTTKLIATTSSTGLLKNPSDNKLVPEEKTKSNQTSPRTTKKYLVTIDSKKTGISSTGSKELTSPTAKIKFVATSEDHQQKIEKNGSKSALNITKAIYSQPKEEVVHRNSVSARSSQTNLEDPKHVKRLSFGHLGHAIARGNTAPSQKKGSISELKPEALLGKGFSKSIQEIPEEGTNSTTHQKAESSSNLNSTLLSASSLSSKEGYLKSKILSLSKKFKMGSSDPKKTKKVASSQVKMFNPPQTGNPSASSYDFSRESEKGEVKTLDDYYIIRRVGKGGFATVFLIRLKASSGRYFALKAIKKTEVVRLKQEKQIMNEKNILFELKHHLLIDLYHTFQSPSNLFMVLEFVAGGDLFTQLRKTKVLVFNLGFY
jgi:hypothetical protein